MKYLIYIYKGPALFFTKTVNFKILFGMYVLNKGNKMIKVLRKVAVVTGGNKRWKK